MKERNAMNIEQSKKIVISTIHEVLEGEVEVLEDMELIGGEPLLNSMKLVEVCLTRRPGR